MSLIQPEDELRKLLEAFAFCVEPLFAINGHNRIVFWNQPLQRLLGWSYDEIAGKPCGNVLAGNDPFGNRYCCDACPIVAIAQRGEPIRQFGLIYRSKDDHDVAVDVAVTKFVLPATKSLILAHVVQPARRIAVDEPPRPALAGHADARVRELTAREIEVLGMLAAGQNATDVASHLGISPLTARNHVQHIFAKLEVHSKAEAVAFAYKMRVVS